MLQILSICVKQLFRLTAGEVLHVTPEVQCSVKHCLVPCRINNSTVANVARGVTRLDGARGKKQVWRPFVQN